MIEVEFEDGSVHNFADNASEDEINQAHARYNANLNRLETPSVGGFLKQAGAGYIAGLRDFGEGIANMTGLMSDEDAKARRQRDSAITSRAGGAVGRLAGNVLPSIALGSGMGAAAGRLASGTRLASLPRVTQYLSGLADSTISGGALADPGERGKGAATGALVSGAVGLVAPALGRTMRGLAQKSDDAAAMETYVAQHAQPGEDYFAPLHQAAGDQTRLSRALKFLYGKALPYIPGVETRLSRQAADQAEGFRTLAAREAAAGAPIAVRGGTGNELLGQVERGISDIRANNVDAMVFNPLVWATGRGGTSTSFADLASDIRASLKQRGALSNQANDVVKEFMSEYENRAASHGGQLTGHDLMAIRDNLIARRDALFAQNIAGKAPGSVPKAEAVQHMIDELDDHIRGTMHPGRKPSARHMPSINAFNDATAAQEGAQVLRRAVGANQGVRAGQGSFSGSDLVQAASATPLNSPFAILGHTQHALDAAAAATPSVVGKGIGVGTQYLAGGPLAPIAFMLGGNLAATKGFQKALLGDTALQAKLLAQAKATDFKAFEALRHIFGDEQMTGNALRMVNEALRAGSAAGAAAGASQE